MSKAPHLKVAIDAQILPGSEGGIEQVLIGLAHGLGKLKQYDDEYVFIGNWQNPDLLTPFIGDNQRIVSGPRPTNLRTERVKNLLGPLRSRAGIVRRKISSQILRKAPNGPSVPVSDGFYEDLGVDVLHLTYPMNVVLSKVPTVFSIYDLQHRHFPQFFSRQHIDWREHAYPAMFSHAKVIAADSTWVKQDVSEKYFIDPDKIDAIPLASPTEGYEPVSKDSMRSVIRHYQLVSEFILYPALTYDHKNHVRLLEAVALLRDRDNLIVNLVCTGAQKHFWPAIEKRMSELAIESQVRFLGFVSSAHLRALYRLASFMVLPSLFEGAGLPLLESFREQKAVACSDIPAFREYGGEAPFFFNPTSVESIASAIRLLSSDLALRTQLAELGAVRIKQFSWERTAAMYRALYLKAAGRHLSDYETELLRGSQSIKMETKIA